jgi:hypothetical protein
MRDALTGLLLASMAIGLMHKAISSGEASFEGDREVLPVVFGSHAAEASSK